MRQSDDKLRCNFCGKSQSVVKKLIAGPSVNICNECIDICNEITADDHKNHSGRPKMGFIEKSCVMTKGDMNRVLARIASQIVSWHGGRQTMRQSVDKLRCSFCGKSQSVVKKLVAGPSVNICNECIDICSEIVADDHKKHSG